MNRIHYKHTMAEAKPKDVAQQLSEHAAMEGDELIHHVPEHHHEIHISELDALVIEMTDMNHKLKLLLDDLYKSRVFVDNWVAISANVPYEVNYLEHKFLFLYSLQAFTLAIRDGGTIPVPANAWVSINLHRGTLLTAQGVSDATPITVLIRAMDDILALQETGSVSLLASSANIGNVGEVSDYPAGAIPIASTSNNVANAAANAFLAGVPGKTTYISGFEVTGTGATAASTVLVNVANIVGGGLIYIYSAVLGPTIENVPLIVQFPKPIPATSQNIGINVGCPALGAGNTNNTVNAHGYQL